MGENRIAYRILEEKLEEKIKLQPRCQKNIHTDHKER
jgi:ribosomal protein S27AE